MQRPFANRAMYFLMAVMALCQVSMGAFKTDDDDLSPENVSPILQAMLKDYDARLPPSQDGSPIDVGVAIIIMDMVPVKRLDLHYSMTLYFRQSWKDSRLAFDNSSSAAGNTSSVTGNASSTPSSITLNHDFLSKIWTPDLYTPQLKESRADDLLIPIQRVVLKNDGEMFTSLKLRMTIYCNMDLSDFPFDHQHCSFRVISYAFPRDQIRLHWLKDTKAVVPPVNKYMAEYTFDSFQRSWEVMNFTYGNYDSLLVRLKFSRNINYYFLQMYLPCCLIVILSWVGFWIDYRSTPARVALGITTVLTMMTFNNSVRSAMPSVDRSKLIDWYLLVSFFFVFMGLVEFVVVGIVDSKWKKRQQILKKKEDDMIELKDRQCNNSNNNISACNTANESAAKRSPREKILSQSNGGSDASLDSNFGSNLVHRKNDDGTVSIDPTVLIFQEFGRFYKLSNKGHLLKSLKNTKRKVDNKLFKKQGERKREGIHILDRISRYLYPLTFLVFNIVYFAYAVTRRTNSATLNME